MSNLLPESYIADSTIQSLTAASDQGDGDYKCLVCIFLFGASDSHNMFVPYGESNPNRLRYDIARAYGVRLENSELTDTLLSGAGPGTAPINIPGAQAYDWALHPSLQGLYSEWSSNNLAIVRDVGVLNRPTTKQQYISNPNDLYRPDRLFAHNIQQLAWQTAVPYRAPRSTGWFGRTTNLIDDIFNEGMRVSSGCTSVSGANPQTFAYSPKVNVVYPPYTWKGGTNRGANVDLWRESRDNLFHYRTPPSSPIGYPPLPTNSVFNAFSQIFKASIKSQNDVSLNAGGWNPNDNGIGQELEAIFTNASSLVSSTVVSTPDPTNPPSSFARTLPNSFFVGTVKNIAKVIYSRGDVGGIGLNQRRQLIFSGVGGWDNHNNLRYFHDPNLRTLDICIKALTDALKVMGVYDQVTVFTETEFSRTFRSNGTYGTDHAWSGHSFVVGGSVQGGIYGPEPDYTLGGPLDVSNLGRFIPNYSIEQYYATMLKWLDIPEELIPLVLPSIDLFTPLDIGFMG